jgi:hypothetical protein
MTSTLFHSDPTAQPSTVRVTVSDVRTATFEITVHPADDVEEQALAAAREHFADAGAPLAHHTTSLVLCEQVLPL